MRSSDTGRFASPDSVDALAVAVDVDGVVVDDVAAAGFAGSAVCGVCPAYAATDEHSTLIVNSDSRTGAVFVMAVTSNREPLRAEGAPIVAPARPPRKCVERPYIR